MSKFQDKNDKVNEPSTSGTYIDSQEDDLVLKWDDDEDDEQQNVDDCRDLNKNEDSNTSSEKLSTKVPAQGQFERTDLSESETCENSNLLKDLNIQISEISVVKEDHVSQFYGEIKTVADPSTDTSNQILDSDTIVTSTDLSKDNLGSINTAGLKVDDVNETTERLIKMDEVICQVPDQNNVLLSKNFEDCVIQPQKNYERLIDRKLVENQMNVGIPVNDTCNNNGSANLYIYDTVDNINNLSNSVSKSVLFSENSESHKFDVKSTQLANQPSASSALETELPSEGNDDFPNLTDSLGLLAESSRVREDEDDDEEERDEDEDFDQDDESNQMVVVHSEDSSAQHSESDTAKEQTDTDTDNPQEYTDEKDRSIQKENKGLDIQDGINFKDTEVAIKNNDHLDDMNSNDAEIMQLTEEIVEEVATIVAIAGTNVTVTPSETPADDIDKELAEETERAVKYLAEPMEIETVKLSDTSDNETENRNEQTDSEATVLSPKDKEKETDTATSVDENKQDEKCLSLEREEMVNFVDLGDISSDDDTQLETIDVTNINLPNDIEIMSSGENTSEIVTKEGEVVISGVPKPKPPQPVRLNTSEVTIKTASNSFEPSLVIPETKVQDKSLISTGKKKYGLEVFSLDTDDEDDELKTLEVEAEPPSTKSTELTKKREMITCLNYRCTSKSKLPFIVADASTMAFYEISRKRKAMVCQPCADVVTERMQGLIEGIKDMTPLLNLDIKTLSQDLVEISDSDSEEEKEGFGEEKKDVIGESGIKFLEEQLADMFNSTWRKFKMDDRLRETEESFKADLERLTKESKEIDIMLTECQLATDKLRNDFYTSFERPKSELPPIVICDTPTNQYQCLEDASLNQFAASNKIETEMTRQLKRKTSLSGESVSKKSTLSRDIDKTKDAGESILDSANKVDDDNVDISVVKLSAEAAPPDLPPTGEITRQPLTVGMSVFAMRNSFGSWLKAKIVDCQHKGPGVPYSMCRVKFEHKVKNQLKLLSARCIAYTEPADVRMTIGTRVIALFKDPASHINKKDAFYSGVVAEIPNPVNNYRYLVFFDDGYAQYVHHADTRLVCECSALVWEEVHPFSREFVRLYLLAYPERPMVRLHAGQSLKTEWNGKWWVSRVIEVDASLVKVHFEEDNRTEWIYRGSTRLAPLYLELQAAERHRGRPLPRSTSNKAQPSMNMPYVEYTRSDQQIISKTESPVQEPKPQRAVAKKSTVSTQPLVAPPVNQQSNLDSVTSRVVYYTPKNAVKPRKMVPHNCTPRCKRTDVIALKDLRTYNPLAKPLLSGWERQIVRYKGLKQVMYRAPCGRRVRTVTELHAYLCLVQSDMPVDLFDFGPSTHCLAEFVLNKCIISKKDLSHGKENVPVPCVNYYDDSLPEFCSYNTERTPTAGVPLNLDPEFLCGCDCTDDCVDKTKCACWRMTLEGARTIGYEGDNLGYVYKKLPEPLPSGIYECNSRCKCRHTCLNRVAQHPLQLKLQVFKTLNRGWGIRALNDVPKGSFLCIYAGNLLTDATANLDGLNEGDEYLAELDYIEVVEQMKEGYEEDIPDADKEKDQASMKSDDEESSSVSEEEGPASKLEKDEEFKPILYSTDTQKFSKMLRKRDKLQKEKENNKQKEKKDAEDDECITISDDEEVREPSRFMAQAGMGANEFVPKHKSVRAHFGEDEACYIMDAKVQGNIGRYLNHSCTPNVFVQNVFVDTHDPRFPWVAFFALSHIRAGTELTWNYNYDVGSVPGKVLYCYCGAPNCRGRLL